MKLEVGMYYTRNKDGELGLCKCGNLTPEEYVETYKKRYGVKNASYNIIDLIEDDDLIKFKIYGELFICKVYNKSLINYDGEVFDLEELDIVSILTKEQYESMSYKVND